MQQHEFTSIIDKWEPEKIDIPLIDIPDAATKPHEKLPQPKGVEPLWRCHKCGGSVRTYNEIKSGKRLFCKCGSSAVVPAWPHWWEVIVLYFRTCRCWYAPWTGTVFLTKKEPSNVRNKRRY